MKTTHLSLIILFLIFSPILPNAIAQDYTTWSLPDDAMARLGKGKITGNIAFSPDGNRLAVASSRDLETIGQAAFTSNDTVYRLNKNNAEFVRNDSIVVVSLPEKKKLYRIILHSDNLEHFVIYVDKGKITKGEDWHRVIEMKEVMSKVIDLKLKMPYYTHQIKIRILKTHLQAQKQKTLRTDSLLGSGNLHRTVITNQSRSKHIPGRIREIEIYGFKSTE